MDFSKIALQDSILQKAFWDWVLRVIAPLFGAGGVKKFGGGDFFPFFFLQISYFDKLKKDWDVWNEFVLDVIWLPMKQQRPKTKAQGSFNNEQEKLFSGTTEQNELMFVQQLISDGL